MIGVGTVDVDCSVLEGTVTKKSELVTPSFLQEAGMQRKIEY